MAYYLTVYQGDGVSLPFKSKYNLTGFTFTAQFSATTDFASTTTAGSIAYANGQFLLTLTASETNTLGSKYFRVRATKSPDTYYIITGYISYVPNTASTIGSSDIDGNGYLKDEALPSLPGGSASVPDANSTTKGIIQLSGDLGGTSSSPTVPGLIAKYTKPGTGIPESDLASGVVSKLNAVGGGSGTVSDASSTVKGVIQLSGDLGGTSASPTVPGLASKAPIASPTFTGTVGGITKSMVGLGNVDNTSDTNKPVSTAQQTALDAKYVKPGSGIPEVDLSASVQNKLNTITRQVVSEKTANYTIQASDEQSLILFNISSAATLTLPPNSSVVLPIGYWVEVMVTGSGTLSVLGANAAGVAILVPTGFISTPSSKNVRLTVQKVSADTWSVTGPLATGTQPDTSQPVVTPPTSVTTLFSDYFPEADNTVVPTSRWALGVNPSANGSSVVIGNAMRLRTGAVGGYSNQDPISRRAVFTDTADLEISFDFKMVGECYPSVFFRSSRSDDPGAGVGYQYSMGLTRIELVNNYNTTELATNVGSYSQNTWYTVKVRASGSSIKVRFWESAGTEPTVWNSSVTNAFKSAGGYVGFRVAGGGTASSSDAFFRNVKVTTPSSDVATPAPTPGVGFISGLSVNGVDGVDKATLPTASPFYTWRGGSKQIGAVSSWADNGVQTTRKVWALSVDGFGPFPGIFDIAIGGLYPGEGQSWANAASGAYDDMYTESLTTIANYRRGKGNAGTYIRPFHEFNGSWYPWALHNAQEIAYFKQTWIRIWNLKQTIFPEAKLHWSPNRETSGLSIKSTDAWPGDAYVDAVAPDIYFQWPGYTTQAAWDNHLMVTDGTGGPKGIEAWRQFALAHGKPLCLPEWGTNSEPGDPAGPYPPYVDQPIAMKSMLDYLEANQGTGAGQFIYANYFNAAGANDPYSGKFGLYPYTESPNAAAAYKAWHTAR